MFRLITIQRISAGTLYKLTGIGLSMSLMPFCLLMGVCALFGASTVTVNRQPVTGVAGLITSFFIGILLTGVFTLFIGTGMVFGLWVYSWFRPLTLLVKVAAVEAVASAEQDR